VQVGILAHVLDRDGVVQRITTALQARRAAGVPALYVSTCRCRPRTWCGRPAHGPSLIEVHHPSPSRSEEMKGKITLVAVPVTALVLFAVPSQCEGPVLIPVSPGHGLSLVDMAAIVPLIAALTMLGLVLVRGRDRLSLVIGRAPWAAAGVLVSGGLGLGLLFASVFPFFWWWAIGATLSTLALVVAVLASIGRIGEPGRDLREGPD
jgi:hypothetical protein